MEISDIEDNLDDIGHGAENVDDAFELLVSKVGQLSSRLAEAKYQHEHGELGPREQDQLDLVYRDGAAGVIVSALDFLYEKDLDAERAIEERLELMRETKEQMEQTSGTPQPDTLAPEDDRSTY